ncbi:hypothetical protein ACFQ1I_31885 [Kitasatospora arboriphila]
MADDPDPTPDFTPEQTARGRALRRAQVPWLLGGALTALALTLVLGLTPAGAGLVTWAGGLFGGSRTAEVLGGAAALAVLGQAVRMPFGARIRAVRARYGLVTQGWGGWALDALRGLGLGLALLLPAALGLYALTGRSPDRWWIPGAVLAALLVTALSFLHPLLIEPVFNRFSSMPAARCGTPCWASRTGTASGCGTSSSRTPRAAPPRSTPTSRASVRPAASWPTTPC